MVTRISRTARGIGIAATVLILAGGVGCDGGPIGGRICTQIGCESGLDVVLEIGS